MPKRGQPAARVFAADGLLTEDALAKLLEAHGVADLLNAPPPPPPAPLALPPFDPRNPEDTCLAFNDPDGARVKTGAMINALAEFAQGTVSVPEALENVPQGGFWAHNQAAVRARDSNRNVFSMMLEMLTGDHGSVNANATGFLLADESVRRIALQ